MPNYIISTPLSGYETGFRYGFEHAFGKIPVTKDDTNQRYNITENLYYPGMIKEWRITPNPHKITENGIYARDKRAFTTTYFEYDYRDTLEIEDYDISDTTFHGTNSGKLYQLWDTLLFAFGTYRQTNDDGNDDPFVSSATDNIPTLRNHIPSIWGLVNIAYNQSYSSGLDASKYTYALLCGMKLDTLRIQAEKGRAIQVIRDFKVQDLALAGSFTTDGISFNKKFNDNAFGGGATGIPFGYTVHPLTDMSYTSILLAPTYITTYGNPSPYNKQLLSGQDIDLDYYFTNVADLEYTAIQDSSWIRNIHIFSWDFELNNHLDTKYGATYANQRYASQLIENNRDIMLRLQFELIRNDELKEIAKHDFCYIRINFKNKFTIFIRNLQFTEAPALDIAETKQIAYRMQLHPIRVSDKPVIEVIT